MRGGGAEKPLSMSITCWWPVGQESEANEPDIVPLGNGSDRAEAVTASASPSVGASDGEVPTTTGAVGSDDSDAPAPLRATTVAVCVAPGSSQVNTAERSLGSETAT